MTAAEFEDELYDQVPKVIGPRLGDLDAVQ